MPRAQLALALSHLPAFEDDRILVGTNTADDAGVVRIAPDRALVQTVDVFAPVVNDPYTFGWIAAVNSISDVYAMGGTPLSAMNVVGFPGGLPPEVLGEMLHGGQDAAREAGIAMMGGHTFQDAEIRYGLAVTGEVHPDRIITNSGGKAGDKLFLTKQLGTGTIIQAMMAHGIVAEAIYQCAVDSMKTLNKAAAEAMNGIARACTDVTGFGLLGHCWEMAEGSGTGAVLWADRLPLLPNVQEYIREGVVEAGIRQNRNSFESHVQINEDVAEEYQSILYSSETSGGLLVAVPAEQAIAFVQKCDMLGVKYSEIGALTCDHIGEVSVSSCKH